MFLRSSTCKTSHGPLKLPRAAFFLFLSPLSIHTPRFALFREAYQQRSISTSARLVKPQPVRHQRHTAVYQCSSCQRSRTHLPPFPATTATTAPLGTPPRTPGSPTLRRLPLSTSTSSAAQNRPLKLQPDSRLSRPTAQSPTALTVDRRGPSNAEWRRIKTAIERHPLVHRLQQAA